MIAFKQLHLNSVYENGEIAELEIRMNEVAGT